MVPPSSSRISRVPPYSRTRRRSTRTGLSPALARLSRRFRFSTPSRWPGPRSLATTDGVSVDVLSSGYLDVSVRRVRLAALCVQAAMTLQGRVSPFGNPRIKVRSQLPAAYRNVLRPSSPLSAKAFTRCPSALDRFPSCAGTSPAHDVSAASRPPSPQVSRPRDPKVVRPAPAAPAASHVPFTMTNIPAGLAGPMAAAAQAAAAFVAFRHPSPAFPPAARRWWR